MARTLLVVSIRAMLSRVASNMHCCIAAEGYLDTLMDLGVQ